MTDKFKNVVYAYRDTKEKLVLVDDKSQSTYLLTERDEDETDQAKIAQEMKEMRTSAGFHSLGPSIVFNPAHVAQVWLDKDEFLLRSINRQSWVSINCTKNNLSKDFFKTAEQFIQLPGFDAWMEKTHITRVFFDPEESQFQFQLDNSTIQNSNKMEAETAKRLIERCSKEGLTIRTLQKIESTEAARPAEKISKENLRTLEDRINARVIGQPHAVRVVSAAVRRSTAGLGEENKPEGSFLLLGPTGVGKTELARQVAEALGLPFKKIDMSEYMEQHNVARLIGSPNGYKDSDEGGQLTNFVIKNKRCVILLDEIEKAHASVANILLQITDDARLTDGRGHEADFSEAIIMITSNLGTQSEKKKEIGFLSNGTKPAIIADDLDEARKDPAVRAFFTPEFLNRLDAVVRFNALEEDDLKKIVKIFIGELKDKLAAKKTTLEIDEPAETYLAKKGFDPLFGARPLRRVIKQELENGIADELLFGELENGGAVSITQAKDQSGLKLRFHAAVNDNRPIETAPAAPAVTPEKWELGR